MRAKGGGLMLRRGSRHHERLNRHRWEAVRLQVLKRDDYRCSHCGKHGRMEVHHVLPLDEGGAAYDPWRIWKHGAGGVTYPMAFRAIISTGCGGGIGLCES